MNGSLYGYMRQSYKGSATSTNLFQVIDYVHLYMQNVMSGSYLFFAFFVLFSYRGCSTLIFSKLSVFITSHTQPSLSETIAGKK